jgi:hypothetical protein
MLDEAGKAHPDLREKIDAARNAPSITSKEPVKTLSPETTKLVDLLEFVSNFGSIQLAFHNANSTARATLTKKVVSHSLYMYNVSLLLQRCSTPGADSASVIKNLAKIIDVGRKISLPHTQWTSYHDATLLFAIAKHGFLDQDASVASIVKDSSISWGEPFEKKGEGANSAKVSIAKHLLAASGKNVASMLNDHRSLFKELKGFDLERVIKTYDLVRSTDNAEQWLYRVRTEVTDEVSDLPPKKDLVRRAKAILSRASDKTPSESHGLASLDPYIAAHAFVEELLRAVLRESSTSVKVAREMYDLALKEIGVLDQACASLASSADIQDMRAMYQKVTEQLTYAKRHMTKSKTQAKNVVKVTLGEEPMKSRREGESALPIISSPNTKPVVVAAKAKPASPQQRISSKTLGERAIEAARKKLFETFSANPNPQPDAFMYLTEVETLIVTIATSHGLPVWVDDWQKLFRNKPSASNSRIFSWHDFYILLTEVADKRVDEYKKRVIRIEKELKASLASEVQDITAQRSIQLQYDSAKDEFNSSVLAFEQIEEYQGELDNLAKKTIMLLAKIHVMMEVPANSTTTTLDGVGHDVVVWMKGEVRRWAESFELLGDDGKPLAYTAVEFLNEVPEEDRTTIEVSTVFDGRNCYWVAAQSASSTRLRSLLNALPDIDILRHHLDDGTVSSTQETTTWPKKPSDWTTASDVTLLWRLLTYGYSPALLSTTDDSYNDVASPSLTTTSPTTTMRVAVPAFSTMKGLSKGHLQFRADRLIRELHTKSKMIQEQRTKLHDDDVIAMIDDSPPKKRKFLAGHVDDGESNNVVHQKKTCSVP